MAVVAIAILGVAGCFFFPRTPEPAYKGKTVNQWLDNAARHKPPEPNVAIYQMGTNAVPWIAARLARNDSRLRNGYRRVRGSLPKWIQKIVPELDPEIDGKQGADILYALRSYGLRHIQWLLKHNSPTVRLAAITTVSDLSATPEEVQRNRLLFIQALHDPFAEVRFKAVLKFRYSDPPATNAIPDLIECLGMPINTAEWHEVFMQSQLAVTLGKFGKQASNAIPELKKGMASAQPDLQISSAAAFWRITGDTTNTIPVLTQNCSLVDMPFVEDGLEALGEMGSKAKPAFQVIAGNYISPLGPAKGKTPYTRIYEWATNTLVSIDSKEAAKIGVFPREQSQREAK